MDKDPVIIIRADADSQMGTGHVMRCIALGQAWQDAGGSVLFLTICDNEKLLQRLRDEQFSVVTLKDPVDFLSELGKHGCGSESRWVVLDGYHFDLACQQSVRLAGHKLLMVDDYNHQPAYECDILLNQNIGADDLEYTIDLSAKRLLGPAYALLRKEFRNEPVKLDCIDGIACKLLVTLGGGDPDNATGRILKGISLLNREDLEVKVIVGVANPNRKLLEVMASSLSCNLELINNVSDMKSMYEWADVAVSAGGSTCWELCFCGLPFLTVIIAENQRRIAEGLMSAGASINLGWHEDLEVGVVSDVLGKLVDSFELRLNQSKLGRRLVDGLGAQHVLEYLV